MFSKSELLGDWYFTFNFLADRGDEFEEVLAFDFIWLFPEVLYALLDCLVRAYFEFFEIIDLFKVGFIKRLEGGVEVAVIIHVILFRESGCVEGVRERLEA